MATLTYVYADQMAVLGPLATYAEPHTYDLCTDHAERLTAPRGWEIVRMISDLPQEDPDDLLAVADALQRQPVRPDADLPGARPPRPSRNTATAKHRVEGVQDDEGADPEPPQGSRLRLLRD